MYGAKKGFTLIELLVVIAIIGILASIVLTALNGARGKSRDATRIAEVKQIRYALELYFGKFNQYPQCLSAGGSCTTSLDTSGFLSKIPTDPLTGIAYTYAGTGSASNCTGYHLGIALEDYTQLPLQADADALSTTGICTGSAANFDGTSHAVAGVVCNATPATSQQAGSLTASGETCYDATQ